MTDGQTDDRRKTDSACMITIKHLLVGWLVGWLVVLRIYVASVVFQQYRDLEAGDNQSLKVQVAKPE